MNIATSEILAALHGYNEAEVRFHIIDPIMRKLGYIGRPDVYLKLEEKLSYPYYHIGRRNPKRDLPLGFPDYRAGLKGDRGSFVVEAKAATAGISEADVEQAHSYAAHAKVGANYYVLCDGNNFVVYETLSGPVKSPIVDITIAEIDVRFHEVENILSPDSLAKNCKVTYDLQLKICDGLGSSVRIRGGEYGMTDWDYRVFINGADSTELAKRFLPQFSEVDNQLNMMQREFELRVSDGFVQRDSDGRITANVNFAGVTRNSLAGMKLLGIDQMSFSTSEKFLSLDDESPTLFESTSDFNVEKGTLIAPLFGAAIPSDIAVEGDVLILARVVKKDDWISGEYSALANYRSNTPMGQLNVELTLNGPLTLQLLA
jgi:hypothetical protein